MKKFNIMLLIATLTMLVLSTGIEAKGSSFGGRSSSFGGSRSSFSGSSRSSSSSFSFGSKNSSSNSSRSSTNNRMFSFGTGAAIGASSSSSNSSKPASVKINRDNVISSLGGKGAKGADAGVLYKSFREKHESSPMNTKKFNMDDINKVFSPTYRSSRRGEYYGGYKPRYTPHYRETVYVNHNSGYGIWDLMLFDSILDNIGDRQMYYHHQNDPAFRDWRTDADKACAAGDTDVCDKLKDLDREMAEYRTKGVKQDPNYVTPGIDPDIYESNHIDPKTLPELKICTGSLGSDYSRFATEITTITKLKVKAVASNGSADNLAKLATGVCDLGFVQNDLTISPNLQVITSLNQLEVGFLMCPISSGVKVMKDLNKDITIYVGSDQTGSQFTLERLRQKVVGLDKVKVNTAFPVMQAVGMIKDSKDSCLFGVSTPKFPGFKELDESGKFQGVPMYSWDFEDKKPTYTLVTIDKGYYKNLTQKDNTGWGTSNGTDSIGVSVSLVAPQAWVDQNRQMFDLLMLERSNLQKSLQ